MSIFLLFERANLSALLVRLSALVVHAGVEPVKSPAHLKAQGYQSCSLRLRLALPRTYLAMVSSQRLHMLVHGFQLCVFGPEALLGLVEFGLHGLVNISLSCRGYPAILHALARLPIAVGIIK